MGKSGYLSHMIQTKNTKLSRFWQSFQILFMLNIGSILSFKHPFITLSSRITSWLNKRLICMCSRQNKVVKVPNTLKKLAKSILQCLNLCKIYNHIYYQIWSQYDTCNFLVSLHRHQKDNIHTLCNIYIYFSLYNLE